MNKQEIIARLELSRERLQYDAERHLHNRNEFMEYGCNCEISGIDKAIHLIKKLNNGWISVNNELPDENKTVLLYAMSRSRGGFIYTIGLINNECWFTESGVGLVSYPNGDNYDVIAWQPLPDPFTQSPTA